MENFFIMTRTIKKPSAIESRKMVFCGGVSRISICDKIKKEFLSIWNSAKNNENSRLFKSEILFEIFTCKWLGSEIESTKKINGITI